MAFSVDSLASSHHLVHGFGYPLTVMRLGPATVRGSSFIEGPSVFGNPNIWPFTTATVMIGPNTNIDMPGGFIPGAVSACGGWNHSPYSLHVVGDLAVNNFLDVAVDINAGGVIRAGKSIISQGGVISKCGFKPFNIKHPDPSKSGWRLVHNCIEGPEIAVYYRGRITNDDKIILPDYWKHLVHEDSITVSITPIKDYQNIAVKEIRDNKVILESKDLKSIDCFYHIFAERKDIEKLTVEYEGDVEDYPVNILK
jgi:hypothetical protein